MKRRNWAHLRFVKSLMSLVNDIWTTLAEGAILQTNSLQRRRTACLSLPARLSEICVMSALPPKADIAKHRWDFRLVPKADIRGRRARVVAYCATNATQIHKKNSC